MSFLEHLKAKVIAAASTTITHRDKFPISDDLVKHIAAAQLSLRAALSLPFKCDQYRDEIIDVQDLTRCTTEYSLQIYF